MSYDNEPPLPRTPTFEGRKPELKNLGYAVEFHELWPLLLGGGLTAAFIFAIMGFGWRPFHWTICVVLALAPLVTAHIYLKKFVENALPHTQEEWSAGLFSLRFDWQRPARRLPFIPSLRRDDAIATEPFDSDSLVHPLLRMAQEVKKAKTPR